MAMKIDIDNKKVTRWAVSKILGQAVGYLAGFSSSLIVAQFFVKKNLWNGFGLFAKREAVNKDTYEWLLFLSSYIIGFLVMQLVTYLLKKYIPSIFGE